MAPVNDEITNEPARELRGAARKASTDTKQSCLGRATRCTRLPPNPVEEAQNRVRAGLGVQ